MKILCSAVMGVVVLLSGCAGYRVQAGGTGPGYDVYTPEPYLKGEPATFENGGSKVASYKFEVVWLPNYSKRYRVHSWAGLGKADFSFTFTDGWRLTALADKSDNSNILSDVIGLVKDLLPAVGITKQTAPEALKLEPLLYRMDFDAEGRVTCLVPVKISPMQTPCVPGSPCAMPSVPCHR
jgi:hypothetical protein